MSELRSALDALAAADLLDCSDAMLLGEIEELLACRNRLDGLIAQRLQVAESRGATVNECGRHTRSWLVEEMRLSPTDAGARMAVARAEVYYPLLAGGLDAGEISHDHARVIARCLRMLPSSWRSEAEAILVEAARSLDPITLGQVAREIRLRSGADEDAAARGARLYDSRWARAATTFEGMLHLEAMLTPDAGATVLAALTPLMTAGPTGPEDTRTSAQRRADAITDLAEHSLGCGWLPDQQGDRPHVAVTIPWQGLRDELADTLGISATIDGIEISAATARRIACDAAILPALLGGDSEILDLGRSSRTWTTAQRRAAALRDRGCVFPGCQAGLDRCRLHHLQFWAHGGRSDLWNSAYLCLFHHWLVHHTTWKIWRNPDGTIEVSRT